MTKTELRTLLSIVHTRRAQYQSRLNELTRLMHAIEADTTLEREDPVGYTELIDEAALFLFTYLKHLHTYNPLIDFIKDSIAKEENESAAYYKLLREHHESVLSFGDTQLANVEEYTLLLAETYALHLERLS